MTCIFNDRIRICLQCSSLSFPSDVAKNLYLLDNEVEGVGVEGIEVNGVKEGLGVGLRGIRRGNEGGVVVSAGLPWWRAQ